MLSDHPHHVKQLPDGRWCCTVGWNQIIYINGLDKAMGREKEFIAEDRDKAIKEAEEFLANI